MRRKVIRRFVLIIVLILGMCSAIGCNAKPSPLTVNYSKPGIVKVDLGFKTPIPAMKDIEALLPMAQPGQGLGQYLCDQDGNSYSNSNIYPQGNVPLYLTLYSYVNENAAYRLVQFVDFAETPISVDKAIYSDGFNFNMPENSYVTLPINIDFKTNGMHEVLFAYIINPNNKSLDEGYRSNTNMSHMLTYRFLININNSNPPSVTYSKPDLLKNNSSKGDTLLNKDKDDWSIWLTDTAKPSETIPCYLHAGTAHHDGKTDMALLVLCDWKQAAFNNGASTMYCELDPNLEAIFPVDIKMPSQEGVYDITAITLPDPYDIQSVAPPLVSFRIGVDVRNTK